MKRRSGFVYIAACAGGLLLGAGGVAQAQDAPPAVEGSSYPSAQDTRLEKKIDARLGRDQKLKARHVDATVSDGIVTLTGTVRTANEKARAERLARTKGVNLVENRIEIEGQEATEVKPSEGKVEERSTRIEERTETRTERVPQPEQKQEGTPSPAPSDRPVPRPAPPAEPTAPAPTPRPSTPPY